MKRRSLLSKLTNYFANDQSIARLRDANFRNCSHRYAVKRPKIAHDGASVTGLLSNPGAGHQPTHIHQHLGLPLVAASFAHLNGVQTLPPQS
jgi:hypothetical protein